MPINYNWSNDKMSKWLVYAVIAAGAVVRNLLDRLSRPDKTSFVSLPLEEDSKLNLFHLNLLLFYENSLAC